MTKAQHSSDSGVFGPRAYFRTAFPRPAVLVIDDIKRHDAATYRCRVDFRKGQTRSFRYNLTVIGKTSVIFLLFLSALLFSFKHDKSLQIYGEQREKGTNYIQVCSLLCASRLNVYITIESE